MRHAKPNPMFHDFWLEQLFPSAREMEIKDLEVFRGTNSRLISLMCSDVSRSAGSKSPFDNADYVIGFLGHEGPCTRRTDRAGARCGGGMSQDIAGTCGERRATMRCGDIEKAQQRML